MGWDELEAIPRDVRGVTQKTEDLDKLCLRVFGTEDGIKFMEWLTAAYLQQPVAVPGADPSFAFYREGNNAVIRDIEARIKRARSL